MTKRPAFFAFAAAAAAAVSAFAADPPKPAGPVEADARLHADGKGWRVDKARVDDPGRPRVLLIGDSILNGYLKSVTRALEGRAYVDAWVNPYCQSEHLNKLLAEVLANGPYDVVHFNMGLHGWQEGRIKPGTFEPLTKAYVEVLRAKLPKARLIWASSTPVTVKDRPTELEPEINPVIVEHNRMAATVMAEMKVPVNDFYALLADKLSLARGDRFHWNGPAYEILAKAVVESVVRELGAAANPLPPPDAAALQRWQAMRFGMFIHWGPVSLKGTEIGWSRGAQVPAEEYDALYKQFNPVNFDAREWARIARDAGMRYVVLTTKHHDGFCLWATKQTDYNIMNTPFARDVTRELADACRAEGLMLCAYHSICDWRHPDYPLGSPGGKTAKPVHDMDRYTAYLKAQLAELLRDCGPLGVLWFDGEWEKPWTTARGEDLYRYLRGLQLSLLINNRISKARAGMAGTSRAGEFAADFDTPEQRVGAYQDARPWETCMTICEQWAWKPDDRMKSLAECLHTLIRTAGGDGNLLFNVGPMPTGEIEPRQVARLREMGAWLRECGESIYETRGGPFKPAPHVVSTRKGNRIYIHVLTWPGEVLSLPAIPARIVASRVLGGGEAGVKQTDAGIELSVPAAARREIDTVVVLELDRPAGEIPAVGIPATKGATP